MVTAVHADLKTDTLYVVSGAAIAPVATGAPDEGTWRSKKFKAANGVPVGFAWVRVTGQLSQGVTLRFYADGALVHTKTSIKTSEPLRMPPIQAVAWEVEMVSKDRVTAVVLTDSTEELL